MRRVCWVCENVLIVTLELVAVGLIVVLVVLLVHRVWVSRRRRELSGLITEAQARENVAPLTTAIVRSEYREQARP